MINYDLLFALNLVERRKSTKVTDMGVKNNHGFFVRFARWYLLE
jgi:hypothetical protein